jgi:hypothetical protein
VEIVERLLTNLALAVGSLQVLSSFVLRAC